MSRWYLVLLGLMLVGCAQTVPATVKVTPTVIATEVVTRTLTITPTATPIPMATLEYPDAYKPGFSFQCGTWQVNGPSNVPFRHVVWDMFGIYPEPGFWIEIGLVDSNESYIVAA